MSDNPAIRVSHLGKKYTIGGPQEKYRTFRDAIVNSAKAPFRRLSSSEPPQEFWALKDVSFDVEPGEVVGIIGRNGAGKSTLLKILSRITSPTEGTVDLYGRVGSLLEVGTGFHPELTGRENIFLSGSILGMKKREIDSKLDEIVKFSEIEKFLDTPAKRYSSGMYVRLAFAVASHLETEILLIDEVLAVGDAQFQEKSLGKMGDVATKEGRTVLFVSHNMAAVNKLCPRSLLLHNGGIIKDDSSKEVIDLYSNQNSILKAFIDWSQKTNAPTDGEVIIVTSISILNRNGISNSTIYAEEPFWIVLEYEILKPVKNCWLGFSINTYNNDVLFFSGDFNFSNLSDNKRNPGKYKSMCKIPENLFNQGTYSISLLCQFPSIKILFHEENVLNFEVLTLTDLIGSLKQPGIIRPILNWDTIKISDKS
jgi:lipopolysaccharide transport system ATP-binding protein